MITEGEKIYDKKKELPEPKMDIVFQSLFKKGNEEITKAFISDIIGRKIQKIDLDKNKVLVREYTKDKLGILDLIATLDDGVICHIEVQLANNNDIEKRMLYYSGKVYTEQMLIGDKYNDLKKTISIAILDYNLKKLEEVEEGHTIWHLREDKIPQLMLTDELEFHIIEIPKIIKMRIQGKKSAVIDWMMFLDNPNKEEVSEIMKSNKEIEEAMKKLEEITADEELMRIIDLKKKAILDENQGKYAAEQRGIEKGKREGKVDVAKEMLKENIDIEIICKVTKLSKEEIEDISVNN